MKKILFLFLLVSSITYANNTPKLNDPKVGDLLIINTPTNHSFNHVDFPNLNVIVKRGGLANYKNVYGLKVIIKEVIVSDNGDKKVVLERHDNKKFFNFLKNVKADYNKALNAGELSKL